MLINLIFILVGVKRILTVFIAETISKRDKTKILGFSPFSYFLLRLKHYPAR
jgi:hypothetical protein